MTNKVYDKKKNRLIIILVFIIALSFIEFPYYISAPGGIDNLKNKIVIDGEYKSKGSFNMTYVLQYKSNIFMLIYGYLNPYIDVEKASEHLADNDTMKSLEFRSKLELKEANATAIIYGYQKAGKNVIINKEDVYVTYILPEAKTNIEVGDIIKKIDGEEITSKTSLFEVIKNKQVDNKIQVEVENNGKAYTRYAYKSLIEEKEIIGILLTVDYEYTVDPSIKLKFSSNESGPSGGLMTTLQIYDKLTSKDITKGYKISGTGTIGIEGSVGEIDGIKYKLRGAVNNHADIFFAPAGDNYEEALKEKEKNNYKIEIVSISTFDEALLYLEGLKEK